MLGDGGLLIRHPDTLALDRQAIRVASARAGSIAFATGHTVLNARKS